MATIHLARHGVHAEVGQVLSGRSDIGLSERGRVQAERVAGRFGQRAIAAVYASPLRRAVETADAIGAACGVSVQTDGAFDEVDFGRWAGRAFAELDGDPAWSRWNAARASALPPEGESMADATARAVRRLLDIATHAAGPVVVVSHCDIIRGVIAHHLGLSLDRLLGFDVDPASVSRLAIGAWGGRVLSINEDWT